LFKDFPKRNWSGAVMTIAKNMRVTDGAIECLLVVGLMFGSAVGCGGTVAETPQAPPPKVTVGNPVERELVDEEDFSGWLQSSKVVEVRARVRGYIQKVHFVDGDLVDSGTLLFELDPRPFQVAIDESIAQSGAYEAQKLAAQKDVERYTQLEKSGGASKQQLDKAIADAASYDAQISALKEQVKKYQLDLEFSRITAPIAGRMSRAMLTEGNLVNAGGSDPLLTTIVALNPMHVYFSVDERTLQRVMRQRRGKDPEPDTPKTLRERKMPFSFGLDSDHGYPHAGVLDFADNRVDPQTGTIQVRGVVDDKQGLFVAGSRVKVRVPVSDPYDAVLVPDSAVLSDQDKRYVLVVDEKNVVTRRDISPGRLLDDGLRVVLTASDTATGVGVSDRIIVQGLQRARLNYPVEPVEAAATPSNDQDGQP
jgi:RND family efflux transporter MFP subunit